MKHEACDERETFENPIPDTQRTSRHSGALNFPQAPQETIAPELSVIAMQLVEAACKARDGDHEAAKTHIARGRSPSRNATPRSARRRSLIQRGDTHRTRGLPAWQKRKVIAHVEAHVSRRITVQELASLLRLSASHFCRAFKSAFRASPRDYIEVAQALMLTTSQPLRSIALSCGMCDQQHFTRSFRRIVGETPSKWRRTRQGTLNVE